MFLSYLSVSLSISLYLNLLMEAIISILEDLQFVSKRSFNVQFIQVITTFTLHSLTPLTLLSEGGQAREATTSVNSIHFCTCGLHQVMCTS